ncbi:hypothetical protein, partial [Staphylococcus hominis]|uniref:hypothetical protein n=1 Tax=Staphylococcus hominis TaxID=1290 RepID=UPI001C92CA6F
HKLIFETHHSNTDEHLTSLNTHIQKQDQQTPKQPTQKIQKIKPQKPKQQHNNPTTLQKSQIPNPIHLENIKP